MRLSSRRVRLRAIWLLVVPFLLLARPRPQLLLAGACIAVAGVALRAWAAGCIRKDDELTTGGPYAFTRNPLYLGSLLIGLGAAVAGGRLVFVVLFLLFFGLVYSRTMRREERLLAERFGPPYRRYRERVPRLLPRLTPYRPPPARRGAGSHDLAGPGNHAVRSFSPSRYLGNREWEAALGTLAGFGFLAAKMLWVG